MWGESCRRKYREMIKAVALRMAFLYMRRVWLECGLHDVDCVFGEYHATIVILCEGRDG